MADGFAVFDLAARPLAVARQNRKQYLHGIFCGNFWAEYRGATSVYPNAVDPNHRQRASGA
jgi:hypothetical protein